MQKYLNKNLLRTIQALSLSCLLALMTVGCGGGGSTTDPTPTATTLNTTLTGSKELPPNASTANGTATVTIDAARTTITLNMTTTGLANVTAAHIHVGGPTVANGGVIFSLFNAATDGTFTGTINKTLISANLSAKPLEGVATFADAVTAILSGNAYINVHTTTQPAFAAGEIRGQLGPVSISPVSITTSLTGANELPVNASTATGAATITIDAARTTITLNMTTTGLANVTAAHIHVGGPTVANGGVIFSLFNAATDGTFTGTINKTLISANLSAKPLEGVATFADAVNVILSGNAYINVHTTTQPAFAAGEIRGQTKSQ